MPAELIFWLVVLCAPGFVPAAIFYRRHYKERPRKEDRFPLGLYIVALLICAFGAFLGGLVWGARFACSGPSSGNLCGLLGFIVVGPFTSIIAVSLLSWLMTYFPLQMKRLVLTGVVLFLIAGGYYSRGFFFDAVMHQNFYQYTLQSDNLDDLHRFAPIVEARMRSLAVLKDVSLNSQIKNHRVVLGVDGQKAMASDVKELPTMTISFSLAPEVALVDATAQIHDMENRLALPSTITASLAKAE
jgi:hypothetical protein